MPAENRSLRTRSCGMRTLMRSLILTSLLCLVLSGLAAGCASGIPRDGTVVGASEWTAAYADYTNHRRFPRRASLELRCPEEELQFSWLSDDTAMVEGCGCRAVYVWPGPLLNSTSGECQANIE